MLDKGVYFFDRIDKVGDENLRHLDGIFFLWNTSENIWMIKEEVKRPKFKNYKLYFANSVGDSILWELAEADKGSVITEVKEVFGDYYAINSELFSLNIQTSMDLL